MGGSRADRFARKLFRMLRSRTQRHNQHLWPFVRIWRNPAGVICGFRAFGRSVPITPLEQGYDPDDDEMHLILSGPSIAEIPYDRLDIRAAMGVNGSIALARKFNLQFKYYCIIDQNFVRDRIDLVREIVACDLTLYVLPDVLRYIMRGFRRKRSAAASASSSSFPSGPTSAAPRPRCSSAWWPRRPTCGCWMPSRAWATASTRRSACSTRTRWPMWRCR
ncbi:hypothetical protein WJ972_00085 [Achromobacter insuavis]